MKDLRECILLKFLSYLLIPVMAIILFVSIFDVAIVSQYGEQNGPEEYVQTEEFGLNYLTTLISNIRSIKKDKIRNQNILEESDGYKSKEYTYFNEIEDESYEYPIFYQTSNYYNTTISNYIKYIIIDEENGNMFTNIRTNNYKDEINNIKTKNTNWNYEDGNIITNIETINKDSIKYIDSDYYSIDNFQGFKVYSNIDPTELSYSNSLYIQQLVYNIFKGHENLPTYLIPITTIMILVMIIYLIWAIGHEKGKEGIQLNSIDKIPYEIISTISIIIMGMTMSFAILSIESQIPQKILLSVFLLCYIIGYFSLAIIVNTTIRRLKAKQFINSFLIYRICKWIIKKIKNLFKKILDKKNENRKITILYCSFIIISIILASFMWTGIGIIILIAFWILVYKQLIKYNKKLHTINNALYQIYEGNPNVKLNEEELEGTLKIMAKYINDIAGGFTNAIEQSLKSERFKTELITNVSHDIKTPLTSIINYIDLLKKQDIKNPQTEQYIAVLDKKSQRLKKLIEDLVEASKVSSGNLKLKVETIDLKQLINQTIAEFEDKLEKKNLKIEMELPHENVLIKADNRYLYRVIENVFTNLTKYALENSRVYINLEKENGKVKLEIKNISKDKLNITAEELMQRFVRGDKSRYTEGSGLGLSIAESLTELQGGKFKIEIDGDLFKVILKFDEEKNVDKVK